MYFFLFFLKYERQDCVSYIQITISSMGSIEDLLILSCCDISNQSVMDTKKIFRNCLRLSQKYSSMDSRVIPTLALPQGMVLLVFSSMSCCTLHFTQLCTCLFSCCCCYCFIFPCVLNWPDWIHIVLLLELIFLVFWV